MTITHRLKRHPIPIDCHFEHSLVCTWAVPAPVLEPLLPPGLTLDTYDDWGFLAVAMVSTTNLRPHGLPAALGWNFVLTGYRLFVRHEDAAGRSRRGLHILRSDTDRRLMKIGGNALTHYNYRLADIAMVASDDRLEVRIETSGAEADLHVVAHLDARPAVLPEASPFRSEIDARRFAGPLPWTFDHEPETGSIVMIHARRSNWRPKATAVEVKECTFLDHAPFAGADVRLANAFHVADIDYGWQRGVRAAPEGTEA